MNRWVLCMFINAVACSSPSRTMTADSELKARPVATPSCLLDFCLNSKILPSEADLLKRFGGKWQKDIYSQHGFCYQFKSEKSEPFFAYLLLRNFEGVYRLVNIRLSRERICKYPFEVESKVTLSTNEGISLDSNVEDVLRVYGKPSYQRTQPSGTYEELMYKTSNAGNKTFSFSYMPAPEQDLLEGEIFFVDKQVIGLKISVEE